MRHAKPKPPAPYATAESALDGLRLSPEQRSLVIEGMCELRKISRHFEESFERWAPDAKARRRNKNLASNALRTLAEVFDGMFVYDLGENALELRRLVPLVKQDVDAMPDVAPKNDVRAMRRNLREEEIDYASFVVRTACISEPIATETLRRILAFVQATELGRNTLRKRRQRGQLREKISV
jgi:hypothetical protein